MQLPRCHCTIDWVKMRLLKTLESLFELKFKRFKNREVFVKRTNSNTSNFKLWVAGPSWLARSAFDVLTSRRLWEGRRRSRPSLKLTRPEVRSQGYLRILSFQSRGRRGRWCRQITISCRRFRQPRWIWRHCYSSRWDWRHSYCTGTRNTLTRVRNIPRM